jgi:hypothetical protein
MGGRQPTQVSPNFAVDECSPSDEDGQLKLLQMWWEKSSSLMSEAELW